MISMTPPPSPPTYECLFEESERQKLPPELLLAVMRTENGKLGQFVKNKNGSYDIGPMQVNTYWLKKLSTMSNSSPIKVAETLANHGCWNMAVGAWILRSALNEAPGDVWKGVGYYNSHTPKFANAYASKVYAQYKKIQEASLKAKVQLSKSNKIASAN